MARVTLGPAGIPGPPGPMGPTGAAGAGLTVTAVSTNTTAALGQALVVNAGGGPVSITLPVSPASTAGMISVKKTDPSANQVTVVGTIDGATNAVLASQNQAILVSWDGTAWQQVVRGSLSNLIGSPGGALTGSFSRASTIASPVLRDVLSVMDYGAKGDGTTNDTTAVQNAINEANTLYGSTGGIVNVILPSGYKFLLGQITPKSGVRLWCYGATIIPTLAWSTSQGMLYGPAAGTLQQFGIYGGYWAGTGTETNFQTVFMVASGHGVQDLTLRDMTINNWGGGPYYIRNPTRVIVSGNRLVNVGQNGGGGPGGPINSINFVFDATAAASGEIVCTDNIVDAAFADSIAVVVTSAAVSGALRVLIANNVVSGMALGGNTNSGQISVELDAATTVSGFLIEGNDVQGYGSSVSGGAIMAGVGGGGGTVQRGRIHNNNIFANANHGVVVAGSAGSEVDVTHNRIQAAGTPISYANSAIAVNQSGNRFSSGPTQGRAVLVAGTVTVSTAEVIAADNIILSRVVTGGTTGQLSVGTITAGTSFVINSSSATDTSTVYWKIDH